CFSDLVGSAASTAKRFNDNPDLDEEVRLEFVFDSRKESDGTASILYTMLSNQPEWGNTGIFDGRVTFEDGQEPRLEMADLLARESMKELDRKITNARPKVRASRLALEQTGKFKFLERGRDYWQQLRDVVYSTQGAEVMAGFLKWLIDTGRVQNGK